MRIGQYRGALQTTNVERTSVITMTCSDVLPDRAKRFLDTLAATYIDYTAEARLATNLQTEVFINGQLEEINALTDTLERQVDYYRAQNEVLDLTREQNEFFNTLVDLERQVARDGRAGGIARRLGRVPFVPRRQRRAAPSSYFMLDDPWMADQIGDLMELEAKRTALLLDVKPGSYQVRRLDSSAQYVRGNVVTYLADKMGTVERRRIDLQAQIRDLESRLVRPAQNPARHPGDGTQTWGERKARGVPARAEGRHHHCPSQHHPGSLVDRARTLRRQSGPGQAPHDS